MKYIVLIYHGTTPSPNGRRGRRRRRKSTSGLRRLPGDQRAPRRHVRRPAASAPGCDHRAGPGRQAAHHRRPVRRDQGGRRRLLGVRGRGSRRRIELAARFRPPAWAARSRCACACTGSDPRPRLPRTLGARGRRADRLPRRHRPRRGSHAGRLRARRGALAADGGPDNPGAWFDDGAQPRHRPHPPRPHAGRQDPPAQVPEAAEDAVDADAISRRATRARLHVLPSCARTRRPGRAHAAHARRPDDRGDRARLPRPRADDGAAAGAGEAQDQGRRYPVPRPPATCCPIASRPCSRWST